MLTAALLVALVALASADTCPYTYTDKCSCSLESTHDGQIVKVVRCLGLSARNAPSLRFLPEGTDVLVVRDSDLESVHGRELALSSTSLRILHLESNRLHDLDLKSILCSLPNLEEAYLSDNTLIRFTIDAECSKNLTVLSLSQNHLHFLSNATLDALDQMENLKLDLNGNTFSCDCNLIPTLLWLQKQSSDRKHSIVVAPDSYICRDGYPEELVGQRIVDLSPDELKCQEPPGVADMMYDSQDDGSLVDAHATIFYSAIAFMGIIAVTLGCFALYLQFPNIGQSLKDWRKEFKKQSPLLSNRKYASLTGETPA